MADSAANSDSISKPVSGTTTADMFNIFFYLIIAIILSVMFVLFVTTTNEIFSMGMMAVIMIVLVIKIVCDVLKFWRKEPFQEKYNFISVFGSSTLDAYQLISYIIPSMWPSPANIVFWGGMIIFFVCGLVRKINQGVSFDKDRYWTSFSLILFFGLLPLIYRFNKGFNVWWMLIIGTILPLVSLLLILAGQVRMNGKHAFKLSNKLPNISHETRVKLKAYKGIFIANIAVVFVIIFALMFQNYTIIKMIAGIVRSIGNTLASAALYMLPLCLGAMSYFAYTSGPMFGDNHKLSEIPAIVTSAYAFLGATLMAIFMKIGPAAALFGLITFVLFVVAASKDDTGYSQPWMSLILLLGIYIVGFNESVRNAISPHIYASPNIAKYVSMTCVYIILLLFLYTFNWFKSITDKISNGIDYSDDEIISITSLTCLLVSIVGGALTSYSAQLAFRYFFVFLGLVGCILLVVSNYMQSNDISVFPFLIFSVIFAILTLPTYLDTSVTKWLPSQAYEITKSGLSLVIVVFSTTLVILGNQFNKAFAEQQTNTDLSSATVKTGATTPTGSSTTITGSLSTTITGSLSTTPTIPGSAQAASSTGTCAKGYYYNYNSSNDLKCEVCHANTYNDSESGNGTCKTCPVNTVTGKTVGAKSIGDCKPITAEYGTSDYGAFINMIIKNKDFIIAPVMGSLFIGTVYMVRSFKKTNNNIITLQ